MLPKLLTTALIAMAILMAGGSAAIAYPGKAVCLGTREKDEFSIAQKQLLKGARDRIEAKFGPVQSTPTVIFFDDKDSFGPLNLNEYGLTSFLGYKTCVILGPKGQNIDVTAHELMHAEIEHRVGYWRRWSQVPTWFDEGLAMQVDHREKYNLPKNAETTYVKQLNSASDFFVADNDLLTNHYAAAKSEVALWLSKVGTDLVYDHLDRLKTGASFPSVWQSSEK